jgi:hypothetical protein
MDANIAMNYIDGHKAVPKAAHHKIGASLDWLSPETVREHPYDIDPAIDKCLTWRHSDPEGKGGHIFRQSNDHE